MRKYTALITVTLVLGICAGGCATKVKRVDIEKKVDLSGQWNDYDAQLVAEEMIADSVRRPWLERFMTRHARKPVIIVGYVANRSHEHINTQVFTKFLERELLNSGRAEFVASPEERDQLRDERTDMQQGFTDPATVKAIGKERGADFMLLGSINSVKDEVRGRYVIMYQVNLELVDLTTNEKVWIGQDLIKKEVKIGKFGY